MPLFLLVTLLLCDPGDPQELIRVNSDSLENFSGGIAKIFGGFDEGVAGRLEESEDGEGEIRQCGKDRSQAGATQVMPIFVPPAQQLVPPTILHEVQ